jgi:hypothetical protein
LVIDAEPSPTQPAVLKYSRAEQSKKRILVSIAGTCIFGLALAGWYVGDRIYAADVVHSGPVSPVVIEPLGAIPSPAPPPAAFVIPVPAPKPPEFYLQAAALGDEQDARFVRHLQLKGYAAKIDESNILIGPYADRAALEHARRRLAGAGILAAELAR